MRPVQILPPPPRAKRRRKKRSWLLSLLTFAFASGVVLFLARSSVVGFFVWKASRDLPDYERLAKYEPPVMTRIHANDGALMAEYARERRIFVPINVIPKMVIQAFLSAEDRRFYEHGGLDFTGIARAIYKNFQNWGKRRAEGASTITQQVAKNFLLSSEQDLERKFKEAILAIRIERDLPEGQDPRALSQRDLSRHGLLRRRRRGAELLRQGAERISRVEEAAYLAALPKAPNNYHPFRRTQEATERRNWIIDQMAEDGYITAEQARAAKAKPLKVNIRPFGTQIYAADYFAEEVRRTLVEMYGEDGLYGRPNAPAAAMACNGGLSVRTTLDPKLQQIGAQGADRRPRRLRPRARAGAGRSQQHRHRRRLGRGRSATIEIPGDIAALAARRRAADRARPRPRSACGRSAAADGSLVAEREAVEIPFDEVKWAKPPTAAAPKAVDRRAQPSATSSGWRPRTRHSRRASGR